MGRLGKLNIGRFLDRALKNNMLVFVVEGIIKCCEDKVFELDSLEYCYSNGLKIYNFDGWCVLESEIDYVEENQHESMDR